MTEYMNILTQNQDYVMVTCLVITVISLGLLIKTRLFLTKIKNLNKSLEQENTTLKMSLELARQRFSDLDMLAQKAEKEKDSWQITASDIEKEFSAYKAAMTVKEETLTEKISYLEKIKDDLTLKFKDISSEIIKTQQETFSNEQKKNLSAIINPFSEQLQAFKAEVVATREESIKNKSNLDAQLANLANMNLALSHDAQNLAEALKGNKKMQGNWGECQLSRILEISGLRKGQDYETQETFVNEDKKIYRPDVIIHLPENRDIIVDSKVSLNDYLDAVNADNEDERQKALQKNVAAIKAHIDELSKKEYHKLLEDRTLNYVIMFIPVESAYIAALDFDRYIYDYAYKENIILATPLSLLPTLRTIENLWRIDSQNQNVQKIAELGGKIYDKLATFLDDMRVLEHGITQAGRAYRKAIKKLSGKGGAVSLSEKMKALGAKASKNINLPLNDNELLLEYNSEETEELLSEEGEE